MVKPVFVLAGLCFCTIRFSSRYKRPHPLDVHPPTLLAQPQMQQPVSMSPMPMGKCHDLRTQLRVAIVAQHTRAHPRELQRPTLAHASTARKPHQLAPGWYGNHFRRSASRLTCAFSSVSASSFFSRAFSVSSCFRRLASGTDIPPNFDFHRE